MSSGEPAAILDDGTLLTGYAPETDVEDGADLITSYKVKSGDTLVTIARKFERVDDDAVVGEQAQVQGRPPRRPGPAHPARLGLVVTTTAADTLESLAAKYDVTEAEDHRAQRPRRPDARRRPGPGPAGRQGRPDPDPQADRQAGRKVRRQAARDHRPPHEQEQRPASYTGGRFHWPVVGGGNYISQYFHSGHGAIDIAADYGSPVVAAAGGRVVFAGWKSNGGGWQVWISHGGGLYTTYNHMSGSRSAPARRVGRGQRVGRVGQSGNATGPHLHFEVWRGGMPWSGG